jgi:predicted ATPase/DNA-binding SARP family transcriptional activator
MSELSLYFLGAPRLELDDRLVVPDTRKAVALLAFLAVTGERHTRDALAALLWPELDQARGRAALRRTLSALKSSIKGHGLDVQRDSLALDPRAGISVDVRSFRHLVRQCQSHGHPRGDVCPDCLPPLSQAAALYQGDFMSGFTLRDSVTFDEWQYLEGESLRRELAAVLRDLSDCLQLTGQYRQAMEVAHRWLALDTLHEPAHRQLMRLLAYNGQRSAAMHQYRECVRILEEELGVPPLDETTELYHAIMAGSLAAPERRPTPQARALGGELLDAGTGAPEMTRPMNLPLVGRAEEWTTMLSWYRGLGPSGRLLAITGEAGIGKTRLAQAFLEQGTDSRALAMAGRCYEGESLLAYGPLADGLRGALARVTDDGWSASVAAAWLSETARLLPELLKRRPDLPPAAPLEGPGAQSRFFEGIRQTIIGLARAHPGSVLLLDDLHWADAATTDLLTYLVRRLDGLPLFLLVTWRTGQLAPSHPLRQALSQAARGGLAHRLELPRLDLVAVRQLVRALPDATDDPELPARLHRETEGLPFFLAEYLAAIEGGAFAVGGDESGTAVRANQTWPMPLSVRELLHSRLAPVSQTGRQILQSGAVIGRSFGFETVRQASGRGEEEVISALEELMDMGLIIEQPGEPGHPVYDFSHEKTRALVYQETSLARRRLLHRRVAETMADHHQAAAPPAAIAHHYRAAGQDEFAAHYFNEAGDGARAVYANAEALAHYRAALALGHPDQAALSESIGDMCTLLADYDGALNSYERAAALRERQDDRAGLARTEHKLGNVYHRLGQYDVAGAQYRLALDHAGQSEERARLMADWSLSAHHGAQPEQARELARQAADLAEQAADLRARARVENVLGILASSQNDLAGASAHLAQSLALASEMDDPAARVAALNNLSLVFRDAGDFTRAREAAGQALDICVELGDRHRQAALHNNLADLFHALGETSASMAHLKQAVTIYAEIGREADEWRPEIWKLMEW